MEVAAQLVRRPIIQSRAFHLEAIAREPAGDCLRSLDGSSVGQDVAAYFPMKEERYGNPL